MTATRARKKPVKPPFPLAVVPIIAGLAMVAILGSGLFRKAQCADAKDLIAAVDFCRDWGSRNLCVIGVDDLIEYRDATSKLQSKFCRAKGYYNPDSVRRDDDVVILIS